MKSLNMQQIAIINDNEYLINKTAICVIASAGSGKSTTIVSKIINMIKVHKCNPENFFITTFTRNAASELKTRLLNDLSEEQVNVMTIGTFHSIAYKYVQDYIIDEKQIIEDNIEKFLYQYELLLDDEDYLDNHQHKYIFIDEYQDINLIQERIIQKLYKRARLLITVGDDQQNIYTFRKTDIKYILDFTKNYTNAKNYYLTHNYRSQKNIIELANIVLSYNVNKLDKQLIAVKTDKVRKIDIVNFSKQIDQINYFVDIIKSNLLSKTFVLHNIAIISRNNSTLKNIECVLADNKIPTYYLETVQDNKITRENIQRIQNRVILSTIHGTKGLEFNTVFMLDIKQGSFPLMMSNCSVEEERRLFYVGITRAKNNLVLSYTDNKPSQFLYEIMQDERSKDIINISTPIIVEPFKINEMTKVMSITRILENMTHEDFENIRVNIFDYKTLQPTIIKLHDEIPKHFSKIWGERNLLISNIFSIFGDFMETFITRTILKYNNINLDNHDYIMMCLSNHRYSIKTLNTDDKAKKYIDNIYGTKLLERDESYINKIKNYFDAGVEIKGKIDKNEINNFILAYKLYCSKKKSNDIVFEIFMIALIKEISRGRTSLQYLMNCSEEFNSKKINKCDFNIYSEWFETINKSSINLVKDYVNVAGQYSVRDDQTQIKGIFDLLLDDTIIEIKSYSDEKPKIEMLIQVLSYVGLARRKGIEINKISIYNPIYGVIYNWDISNWIKHNELIDYMYNLVSST